MYVYVGKITKPQGLKGQAVIRLENLDDSQVAVGKKLYLKEDAAYRPLTIEAINLQHKNPLIKLESIDDRTAVEKMIPCEVYLSREDFEEDEGIYLVDLIGAKVFDQHQKELGELTEYYNSGAQDIAIVKGTENFEFPFIEPFIQDIDVENKKVIINKPEVIE